MPASASTQVAITDETFRLPAALQQLICLADAADGNARIRQVCDLLPVLTSCAPWALTGITAWPALHAFLAKALPGDVATPADEIAAGITPAVVQALRTMLQDMSLNIFSSTD